MWWLLKDRPQSKKLMVEYLYHDFVIFITEYRGFFVRKQNFTNIIFRCTCLRTKNLRIILNKFHYHGFPPVIMMGCSHGEFLLRSAGINLKTRKQNVIYYPYSTFISRINTAWIPWRKRSFPLFYCWEIRHVCAHKIT